MLRRMQRRGVTSKESDRVLRELRPGCTSGVLWRAIHSRGRLVLRGVRTWPRTTSHEEKSTRCQSAGPRTSTQRCEMCAMSGARRRLQASRYAEPGWGRRAVRPMGPLAVCGRACPGLGPWPSRRRNCSIGSEYRCGCWNRSRNRNRGCWGATNTSAAVIRDSGSVDSLAWCGGRCCGGGGWQCRRRWEGSPAITGDACSAYGLVRRVGRTKIVRCLRVGAWGGHALCLPWGWG